jgi:NADH-quinone oxidoreductase subunit L
MLILIILLPLLSFFSISLFGRYIRWGIGYIPIINIFFSLLFSFILFYDIVQTGVTNKLFVDYCGVVDFLYTDWCFCFDSLISVRLIVVTFISTLVHLYSTKWMTSDVHCLKFISYLSLLTFSILMFIVADNFLQLFISWKGEVILHFIKKIR